MAGYRLSVLLRVVGGDVSRVLSLPKYRPVAKVTSSFSYSACQHDGDIESKKVEVNGVQLHYERTGKGDHSILLLPGALGSTRTDFGPQLEKLDRERFTVIGWDPRGYGKSRPPDRDWPLDFYHRDAEDAVGLIKALGLSKVSLLGWSDGGITALIIAGRYPDLCHKLVVWGSNAYVSAQDVTCTTAIKDLEKWSDRMKKPFLDVYGETYFREQWLSWVDAYHRINQEKNGDICKGEVSRITCPSLIVHGQLDPLVDQEHPDYLHANIKQSRLVNWPKAKHNLHLRYADEFNTTVQEFLAEN